MGIKFALISHYGWKKVLVGEVSQGRARADWLNLVAQVVNQPITWRSAQKSKAKTKRAYFSTRNYFFESKKAQNKQEQTIACEVAQQLFVFERFASRILEFYVWEMEKGIRRAFHKATTDSTSNPLEEYKGKF